MVVGKDEFDQVIHDSRLDWDELGLLVYLLGHGERFVMSMQELYRLRQSGRLRIDRCVARLEELGYVRRTRDRSGGRYGVTRWTIRVPRA